MGEATNRTRPLLLLGATIDVIGFSHAAYEQISYSPLMPRTSPCARLLETLD